MIVLVRGVGDVGSAVALNGCLPAVLRSANIVPVTLRWQKFSKLTAARSRFARVSCVYVQADASGCPVRIGRASEGLDARYHGGTGYALDAAMHGSQNVVFVAEVPPDLCRAVEEEAIWQGRRCLTYSNQGQDHGSPATPCRCS